MKRILIDLTDLETWSGNHGGTQRVVYGLAKEYYLHGGTDGQKVVFVSFSSAEHAFYESDFRPIMERTESAKQQATSPSGPGGLSLKSRIKYKVRPFVPEAVRKSPLARRAAKKTLSSALKVARTGKQLRASAKPGATALGSKIVFTENDIVLVAGKPWDSPTMQKVLARHKEQAGFKLVQVVYDLIIPLRPHLHHPTLFKAYVQNMFEAIDASDLMLPISESSDRDLKIFAERLNLKPPHTEVIRLAENIVDDAEPSKVAPDGRIQKKFIACVGTIEIRKNHMLLYYAYKLAATKGIELPQLVIVGSRGWLTGDFQYLIDHDPEVQDRIVIVDNANDAALDWVYRNCLFTVYPSMYEGWGLPVAESLAYGKFCLSSNISSMPEIAGDMIDYFSPFDAAECLQKISHYAQPANLAQANKKIAKYQTTHWDETFKRLQKRLEELN